MKYYILWFWSGRSLKIATNNIFEYEVEYANSLEYVEEITEADYERSYKKRN